jgi:2-methylisocitrate lyase-like PEP mutase family enzyme
MASQRALPCRKASIVCTWYVVIIIRGLHSWERCNTNRCMQTGAGTTMSRLGMADMGIATMNDMKANAEMIANLDPSVPLIADADTGYGGPIMAGRTVAQYIRAGVAGLHLEDQVVNKRCGHLKGKELVSIAEYASRIKAAPRVRVRRSHQAPSGRYCRGC